MKKRVTIYEGDIFKIVDKNEHRYFQFFYNDIENLSADLIWVFNIKEDTNDLDKIQQSGYMFYMYTFIKIGIKLNKFSKIGNKTIPEQMRYIPKFRWTDNDLRSEAIDWYIVLGNKKIFVGEKLTEEQKKYPFYSPNFPKGAVEDMILGYKAFMKLD